MEDFRRTSACGVFNDPKLFPSPSHEAMRIVSDIRRIDTYGDSSVIACLTYSEAAQLVEDYAAAQRQAGREEEKQAASDYWCEYWKEKWSEDWKRYAALVEAARKRIATSCVTCGWKHQCGGCAYAEIRKALRALDEAKGGK